MFGLGAPVLGSVPAVTPIPPLPLPDILSQAVAGDWSVLPLLCSLLCVMGEFCAPGMNKREDLRNDLGFGLCESTSSVLSSPQPH